MLPEAQKYFANHIFSEDKHQKFLQQLNIDCGMNIDFRIAEMPIFISNDFGKELVQAAIDIACECLENPHSAYSSECIPDQYRVPQESSKPLFIVIDFAITTNQEGDFIPKVIELQGFPSLFGYQYQYGKTFLNHYQLNDTYSCFFKGIDESTYIQLLKEALIGNHDPDETCLLEYKPDLQKTRPDFLVLEKLTGIKTTDIESVQKHENSLYHIRNGKSVKIKRIFNRAIADELEEKKALLNFDWRDELDVEWAGHPNWYFKISKHSLPYLRHKSVPSTHFLSEISEIPKDLEPFVLKPLFAFSGKGVIINPREHDIMSIPKSEQHNYVLQEKITYADCVFTPEGYNKAEIRIMLLWPENSEKPIPMMSLARTGRGPMMGVRYNNIPWTGSAGCLFGY